MNDPYTHSFIETNSITLHIVSTGDPRGQPVILLHGFPEFWFGWRHQIPALAQAGFHVIVPDQRGYNLSAKPAGIEAYQVGQLAQDVQGIMDHFKLGQAAVVGHDWGAAVAWQLAIHHPERVEKVAILNVPHPAIMMKFLRRSVKQMLKSWYAGFFQIPRLPETLLSLAHFAPMVNLLRTSAKEGTFSPTDLEEYKQAWAQPGALTAMLNWYRAAFRHQAEMQAQEQVTVPCLILWGKRDIALSEEMAVESIEYCDHGQLIYFEKSTHWVQHDEVDAVNKYLLDFLKG